MNRRSQVPSQMRHEQKCESSSGESDPDADGFDSEEAEEAKIGTEKLISMALGAADSKLQSKMDMFGLKKRTDFSNDNP